MLIRFSQVRQFSTVQFSGKVTLERDHSQAGSLESKPDVFSMEATPGQTQKILNMVNRVAPQIGRKGGYEMCLADDNEQTYRLNLLDGHAVLQGGPKVLIRRMQTPGSAPGKEPIAVLREIEGLDYELRCVNGALHETVVIHKTDGNQITFTEPHKLAFMDHKMAAGPVHFLFLNLNTRLARQIEKRLKNREAELNKKRAKKTRNELKNRQALEAEATRVIGAALRGDSAKKWRGKQEAVPSNLQLYVSTDLQSKRFGEDSASAKKCSESMWNFINPNRLKGDD
jgi:hypothetical protein